MKLTVNPFTLPSWQTRGFAAKARGAGDNDRDDPEKVKAVAREFEGLMMEQMVREMRRAVPKADLLGRQMDQELFSEMLDGEFVKLMTERGGIGLTDFLVQSLSKGEK